MTQAELIDQNFYTTGDEDCGVELHCRKCDRGGLPIAYLTGITSGYPGDNDVVSVNGIAPLLDAGLAHLADRHAE